MIRNVSILIVLLSLCSTASAQEDLFVGEESLVATYQFYSNSHCKPSVSGPLKPTRFTWNNGRVTSYFTTPGEYHDTALFDVYYADSYCGDSRRHTLTATARVRNDSVVRMLPRQLSLTLYPDTIGGGWQGVVPQHIKHKIGFESNISDWTIVIDSTMEASIRVTRNGVPIQEFQAAQFESDIELQYEIRVNEGPIFNDISKSGLISCRVKNAEKDSIYTTPVHITIKHTEWKPQFGFTSDTVRFTAVTGQLATSFAAIYVDPRAIRSTFRSLRGTIATSDAELVPGREAKIPLHGSARTPGRYLERLTSHLVMPDHNGDLREDSDEVIIELTVLGEHEQSYWEPTDGAMSIVDQLSSTLSGEVYCGGENLFRSSNSGESWIQIPIPHKGIHGHYTTNSGTILIIGDDQRVYRSTDQGIDWDTTLIGFTRFWIFEYFVPYDIHKILGSGEMVTASGSATYFEDRDREMVTSTGTRVSTDDGLTWIGNSDYSSVSHLAKDSAGYYLAANSDYVFYSLTSERSRFRMPVVGLGVDGAGYFYSLTEDGLHVSTDAGYSWGRKSLVFPSVNGFNVAPDGELFVSTAKDGVYRSTDGGLNWEVTIGGLGITNLSSMTLVAGGHVFVGTRGGGVYRSIEKTKLFDPSQVNNSRLSEELVRVRREGREHALYPLKANVIISAFDLLGRVVQVDRDADRYAIRSDQPLIIRAVSNSQTQTIKLW